MCVCVVQDGSCNGLQHYAALGRDMAGAQSVNLWPYDRPQDVYSDVCDLVSGSVQSVRQSVGQCVVAFRPVSVSGSVCGVVICGTVSQLWMKWPVAGLVH